MWKKWAEFSERAEEVRTVPERGFHVEAKRYLPRWNTPSFPAGGGGLLNHTEVRGLM